MARMSMDLIRDRVLPKIGHHFDVFFCKSFKKKKFVKLMT